MALVTSNFFSCFWQHLASENPWLGENPLGFTGSVQWLGGAPLNSFCHWAERVQTVSFVSVNRNMRKKERKDWSNEQVERTQIKKKQSKGLKKNRRKKGRSKGHTKAFSITGPKVAFLLITILTKFFLVLLVRHLFLLGHISMSSERQRHFRPLASLLFPFLSTKPPICEVGLDITA